MQGVRKACAQGEHLEVLGGEVVGGEVVGGEVVGGEVVGQGAEGAARGVGEGWRQGGLLR